MSTCPGYTLEEFVAWNLDINPDTIRSVNVSLDFAEALGTASSKRPVFSDGELNKVVAVYEPYRKQIEDTLSRYYDMEDEEYGLPSWRDFAGYNFDFIPDEVVTDAIKIRQSILESRGESSETHRIHRVEQAS